MTCEMHGREGCACLDRYKVQTEYERSLSRCVVAVVVTIVTLAIVAVLR